jgi:hypothetical protein
MEQVRANANRALYGRTLARKIDLLVDNKLTLEDLHFSGRQTGNLGQNLVADCDLGSQFVLGQIGDQMAANEAYTSKDDNALGHSIILDEFEGSREGCTRRKVD